MSSPIKLSGRRYLVVSSVEAIANPFRVKQMQEGSKEEVVTRMQLRQKRCHGNPEKGAYIGI